MVLRLGHHVEVGSSCCNSYGGAGSPCGAAGSTYHVGIDLPSLGLIRIVGCPLTVAELDMSLG